jgi:CheY-like chemotaxis protein
MPKQILLADDSATIARIVQITFANEDAVVTAVKSGDEALARARAARPDIVLLDAQMPGKSGYDTCAELRAAGLSDVPVLILTGNFGPYDEARGRSAGADGNVVKPFETQALIDRVSQLIAQRGGGARPAAAAPVAPPARVEPHPPPVSAPPVAPPTPPAPPPRATAMGIPSVNPALAGPPGATAMGIPSATPSAPPAPPKPSVPPAMTTPARPAAPPPGSRPAPPPRATLMGIPTVNPATLANLQASIVSPVAPTPPVKPPAPAQQQAHHEERTLVEMDAPKLPAQPVAAPPPVVHAPPPVVHAAPPVVHAPPPVVAAPPPPVVHAAPPVAPPRPAVSPNTVPTVEMAAPSAITQPTHAPAKLVALPSNAPQMPRPSLIPGAPTPQARAKRNDFDDSFENEQMTRKVDLPIPSQARPEQLAPIVRAVTAAVVSDIAPTAPAGGGAASLSSRGPEYEALTKLSREVIEQIVWEVVPDLAEQIIRSELDRLVKERRGA